MLSGMNVTPGVGVDFGALQTLLAIVAGVYLLSSVFAWGQSYIMAGVTQRTVYRLRQRVDAKLGRLPLSYFDRQSRGDILSRVTNDIDNISQTLQQSLTQLITSILTVIGVLLIMLTISPLLAVISILVVPASIVVTVLIAGRSQRQFAAQWERTGTLNGHIEEMHTGHAIVKLFGRQEEAIDQFDAMNEQLYQASYKAQFISGIIQPAMTFVSNLNYVAIAVIGGVRVASGQLSPRRRPGVHPVLAPVHDADHPGRLDRQRAPERRGIRGARVRVARRGRGDSGRRHRPRSARSRLGPRRVPGRRIPVRARQAA